MKKVLSLVLSIAVAVTCLAGCGGGMGTAITVLSREEGSGTRGAFVELMGVEEEVNGEDVDATTAAAEITNSTSVMLTTVNGNKSAIGYVSLGSLNDTVKALKIDGVEPSTANIKSGNYKVSRPFNIVTKGELTAEAEDFIGFIMSAEGQETVEKAGYISEGNSGKYTAKNLSGTVKVGGSSSVSPVMQKLKEAYEKLNAEVTVEIQESDSTTGINGVAEGSFQIGMASRELKDEEEDKGLKAQVIAIDGIAIIVNQENETEELTSEAVRSIYLGETTDWSELKK